MYPYLNFTTLTSRTVLFKDFMFLALLTFMAYLSHTYLPYIYYTGSDDGQSPSKKEKH